MTKPKRHLPGEVVFLTRRTDRRQFMLKPDEEVTNMMGYLYGLKATQHGQLPHAAMTMSNHLHAVQTDVGGTRSDFMQECYAQITRCRNSQLNRRGHFWASGEPGDTALLDVAEFEQKCLYTWLNPVEAGLVERAEDWVGFQILPRHWGKTMRFERPDYYRPNGPMPDYVEFTPQPPPGYEHMELEEVIDHFETKLREAEDAIRKRREGRPVMGIEKVLQVGVYDHPKTPAPMRQLNPRLSGSDPELVRKAISALHTFYAQHQDARWRFYDGERTAGFPAGTIQLQKLANVRIRAAQPDDPFLHWQRQAANTDQATAESDAA